MESRFSPLRAMFSPQTVVHIGASETGLYPADVFRSLLASNVTVHPVNRNRTTVFGEPCFTSVADLPDRTGRPGKADLAVITIPAPGVSLVLEDCIREGIPAAVVFSSGFAEAGEAGRALQRTLESLRDRILILGPNCAGFANVASNVTAARLYSSAPAGGVSVISQSGALMMALHGVFVERGCGPGLLVSVGNQAGVRASDVLEYCAGDPGTRVAAAFLEGLPDGQAFVDAVSACFDAGKPVVVVKSGRTELGRRLAATHTGALAGEGKVFEGVCRQYGVVLVDDIDELVATAHLFDDAAGKPVGRIAWLSQSGGLGSLAADLARNAGIEPEPFPPELGGGLNPVDVGGDRLRGDAAGTTLAPYLASGKIDAAVLLFAKNPNREVELETARSIVETRKTCGKPVIVVWIGAAGGGGNALRVLAEAGIPVFGSPGPAVRALARVSGLARFRMLRKTGLSAAASPAAEEGGRHARL